jgi:hypothetical protein
MGVMIHAASTNTKHTHPNESHFDAAILTEYTAC